MNIGKTGIWDTNSKETYEFDMPLAFAICLALFAARGLGLSCGRRRQQKQSENQRQAGNHQQRNPGDRQPRQADFRQQVQRRHCIRATLFAFGFRSPLRG